MSAPRCGFLSLVLASCVGTGEVDLPRIDGASAIVLLAEARGEVSAYALSTDALFTISLPPSQSTLVALYYARSLEDMFLAPGEIALEHDPLAPSAAFPAPLALFEASGDPLELHAAEASEVFLRARLPLDVKACVTRGGCYPEPDAMCLRCPRADRPESPAAPAFPRFLPCPAGWEITADGACEPIAPAPCSDGTMWSPGRSPACVPITRACPPPGEFASGLAGPNVVFVREGSDGLGTRDEPFGALDVALLNATDGSTIAVAAGRYAAASAQSSVVIAGACDAVILERLDVVSGFVRVRDVKFAPLLVPGVRVRDGATLDLERVLMSGAGGGGVLARVDGGFRARDVAFRDAAGTAIIVQTGTLALDRVEIDSNTLSAIDVFESRAGLADVWIHDVGHSAIVSTSSTIAVERALLERGLDGIDLIRTSSATVEDVVLRGFTYANLASENGSDMRVERALIVDSGTALYLNAGRMNASDVAIAETSSLAFAAYVVLESELRVERIYVRDPRGNTFSLGGAHHELYDVIVDRSLEEAIGSTRSARVERALIRESVSTAVWSASGLLELADIDVRDAKDYAISADHGEITAKRVRIERGTSTAIFSSGVGATFAGEDVFIAGVAKSICPLIIHARECGVGVLFEDGAKGRLDHFHISGADYAGFVVDRGGEADATRGTITGNLAGIAVDPPSFDVTRLLRNVLIEENSEPVLLPKTP